MDQENNSRMFQIHEGDLLSLETTLPQLAHALTPVLNNRLRVQLRQVQQVLSNVRWNYGPPTEMRVVDPGGDQTL